MANLSLGLQAESEVIPFLMEHLGNESESREEHVVVIPRVVDGMTTVCHEDGTNNYDSLNTLDTPSSSTNFYTAPLSAISDARNIPVRRTGGDQSQHNRNQLNVGLWTCIDFFVNLSQIIAAIIVLSLSRNEKPRTPLFTWVVGYTVGCIITLPHILWRYLQRNTQITEHETTSDQSGSSDYPSRSINTILSIDQTAEEENSRDSGTRSQMDIVKSLVGLSKMALDCFFAVWFVVGNVWVFGGHSSASDAPNLYRLCIVFLSLSCIGYAMPFILCATLCCCLPCIISMLGLQGDLNPNRGATTEHINTLPTYIFKSKHIQKRGDHETNLDAPCEGGVLAAGTDRERIVSAEDAVCCICLSKYEDDNVLRELPCSHFFHMECVDKWLKINALCPLCKSEIEEITCSDP